MPAQLMPVRIAEVIEDKPRREQTGTVHIELGRARIRVEGSVDAEALRGNLEQLGR